MSLLSIYLFGNVRVTCKDSPDERVKIPPTSMALLSYLLLYRSRSHRREILAGIFWGDMKERRAKRCLNTTLWRLRSTLKINNSPECCVFETVIPGEIQFNKDSDVWIDVAVFERSIENALLHRGSALEIKDLEKACQLYGGDLLEGYYEDWVLRERERLRELYIKSLAGLMEFYRLENNMKKSLKYGQKILDIDPLREEVHRVMMQMYTRNGQRNLAIQQYKTCCEILKAELNIDPMLETKLLYDEITNTHRADSKHWVNLKEFDNLSYKQAVDDLYEVIRKLEMVQLDVQYVMKYLTNPNKN